MADPTSRDHIDGVIEDLLDRLTLDEKAALTAGADNWHTTPVPRLGIGPLKVTDGPNGARGDGASGATAACFPVGSALGATWDVDMLGRIGDALADEALSKGARVLLGPTVNIHRTPLGGRNFECYSEDPLLTGTLAATFINALQARGVGASIKHFVANDSEFERMSISSDVDERTLREIYLRPFELAVTAADPWTVMASYNRLNATFACEHRWLLTEVLRNEWGWQGVVVSDWGAVHSTEPTIVAGLDLEMPGPARHLGASVAAAVRSGTIDEAAIDASTSRVLGLLHRTGCLDTSDTAPEPPERSEDRPEHRALAREAAAAGMVLLRNDGPVLPLDVPSLSRVAVIGPNAEKGQFQGGGSSVVNPHHVSHPLAALREVLEGAGVEVVHEPGCEPAGMLPHVTPDLWKPGEDGDVRGVLLEYFADPDLADGRPPLLSRRVWNMGAVWFGYDVDGLDTGHFACRYTATVVPSVSGRHRFGIAASGRSRVTVDGVTVADNWTDPEPGGSMFGMGSAEVAGEVHLEAGRAHIVTAEYGRDGHPGETAVRVSWAPPAEPGLLDRAVKAASQADAVIAVVGSPADWESEGYDRPHMRLPGRQDELIAAVAAVNPRTVVVLNCGSPVEMPWLDGVPAVLQVWFPGQAFGQALADVLSGAAEPGGRLPTTFGRRVEDCPAWLSYPGEGGHARYGEGVFVGYRGFDELGTEPLFPFGHGLGYTNFDISEVAAGPDGTGGVHASATVRNSGTRTGSTVVQLYVSDVRSSVRRPPKELGAFEKVVLDPGEARTLHFSLGPRVFSFFDPAARIWTIEPGAFDILVGRSSRDIAGTARVTLS